MAKMSGGVIGVLIGLMITMLVGIIIVTSLVANISQSGWSATANTTWTNLQTNIWTAYALLIIIPIVVGAVAILAYVRFGG